MKILIKNLIVLSFLFIIILSACSKKSVFDIKELNSEIKIDNQNKYIFLSKSTNAEDTILMFYPGGLVHEDAYIEPLSKIVEKGINVVIIRMRFDLAVFSKNRGIKQMDKFSKVKTWFIAGHSLGGAMCCSVIDEYPDEFKGLLLWASYPGDKADISDYNRKVLSIHASEDGLSTIEKIDAKKSLLPTTTEYYLIQGGNHAQFATYGLQKGDGTATISKEEQQNLISNKTVDFIKLK